MQFKIDHRLKHQPLVHGKRDDGSQVVDAALVRTRHTGFLQDLINTSPTPAICTHRPPTRANGLSRALTASLSGRCQIMLKESTVLPSRAS